MQPDLVAVNHDYWRMLASMFLHLGLLHILFNMWALYVLGDFLESVLGSVKFLAVYLLSGLAGSCSSSFPRRCTYLRWAPPAPSSASSAPWPCTPFATGTATLWPAAS